MLTGAAKIFGKLYLGAGANFNAGRVQDGSVAMIASEARVYPGCTFDGRVTIGPRTRLYEQSLFIGATISNDVLVQAYSTIYGKLGNSVRIGDFSMVLNGAYAEQHSEIGDFSILGEGSTLTQEIKIGINSCIGAGLVVTKNVGDSVIMNKRGELEKVPPRKYVKYADGRCVITGKQIELFSYDLFQL